MKKLFLVFSSTITMAVLLVIFAGSIAVATFIENDFGSSAARSLVYNARWFEILLLLGMINLIAVIFKRKVYKKPTLFLFHISFLLIILGAGITRYFGFEGIMHVREGETSDEVLTDKSYISCQANFGEAYKEAVVPVNLNELTPDKCKVQLNPGSKQVRIKLKKYLPAAVQQLESDPNGSPAADIVVQGGLSVFIHNGETIIAAGLKFTFDTIQPDTNTIMIKFSEDNLWCKTMKDFTVTDMMDQSVQKKKGGSFHRFYPKMLYNFNGTLVVLRNFLPSAIIVCAPPDDTKNTGLPEALLFEISSGNQLKELWYQGRKDEPGKILTTDINDIVVRVTYGPGKTGLPFKLRLSDFIIERYPGTSKPSWFESRVNLPDGNGSPDKEYRIYMNHILKHKGYRFYQASYDADEKGTILAVNYDRAGTSVTYTGYFLMALGMMISLFSRRSRFANLFKETIRLSNTKKTLTFIILALMISGFKANGADETPAINPEHAKLFGTILIQDHNGRIKPLNTLASEVLRKMARKTSYNDMSADQVFLGIMSFPETWQNIPLIRVGHKQISEILGTNNSLVPFSAFFSKDNAAYLLSDYVEKANATKPAKRSKFDNELIRVDERVNIFYLVYTGNLLNIFPKQEDPGQKWYPPFNASVNFNSDDSVFVNNIIPYYLSKVREAVGSGNWTNADELVNAVKAFQEKYGAKIIPPSSKIRLELLYNRLDIFQRLSSYYGLIGFVLLMLQFAGIFFLKLKLKIPVRIAIVLIVAGFAAHTFALAARWYISGHAPWSNGYEALTYIAWGVILAGIIFSRISSITISTAALLSSLILTTAHLSWMDPEITNLVPVLKSYWLVIHVAIITSSYAFLGLGSILALINLIIMFLESASSKKRIDLTIREMSNIIELMLIPGLYLLAVGTFIGGVWANESWGRYWGWDPKETWALVTVLAYAFVVHMRLIPRLKGLFSFNLAALLGFGFVLMTYFGVNYYLSGLHSYAKGDPVPVPHIVYYTVISVALLATLAYINQNRLKRADSN